MKKKKLPVYFSAVVVSGAFLFFSAYSAYAQYDYYDPYSNSNIDYYPMNPVYTSPSGTYDSGTVSDTSSGTTGGTTDGSTAVTTTACANQPLANPQNTRSVEVRDTSGKVFYLSPPKEELVGIRAYPETSTKIFQVIYGTTGMQIDEKEVGLITVDNRCYPKYGYVQNSAVTTSDTSSSVTSSSVTTTVSSTVVPEDATAVRLDPATGKVYNAKTGELISQARYDAALRKIYYKDTNSTYGTVFTDTTGYVNIDLRGVVDTYAAPSSTYTGDPDFDLLKVSPTPVSAGDVDRDGAIDKKAPPPPPSPPKDLTGSDSGVSDADDKITGDPDFDLLNVDLRGDALEKFRAEAVAVDQTGNVAVRGWDPKKKEEIFGHPEEVRTAEDLKVYVEAVALNDAAIKGIEIKLGVLELESREQGKLFGFIPVEMSSRVVVRFTPTDSTEDPVDVKFPWWRIFVKKNYGPGELKGEISGALTYATQMRSKDAGESSNASRVAQALQLVSNIMKTKHDTVKNSISNVR